MISRSFAENQEYPPLTSTKISKFQKKSEISDFFQTNIIRLSEIQTLAEISDLRISTDYVSTNQRTLFQPIRDHYYVSNNQISAL